MRLMHFWLPLTLVAVGTPLLAYANSPTTSVTPTPTASVTPTPAASVTPTATASVTPTANAGLHTLLAPNAQFIYDLVAAAISLLEFVIGAVVVLVIATVVVELITKIKVPAPDTPAETAVKDFAQTTNTAYLPRAAERGRAAADAADLIEALNPPGVPPLANVQYWSTVIGTPPPAPLTRNPRDDLEVFIRQAYAAMLRSQFMLLDGLNGAHAGTMALVDIEIYWRNVRSRGLTLGYDEWLQYLERCGLIDAVTGAQPGTRRITALGKMFLGWCEREHLDQQSIVRAGRDL